MGPIVGIVALVCNFSGIVLLVRYGLPYRLLALGTQFLTKMSEKDLSDDDRRKMLGFLGLVLLGLGTGVQIVSIALGV
ncbi:MAG: hypothetical protein Q7T08_12345 [Devosia sp.]|nr:hypothetical protein [Devosia sp.]